LVRVELFGDGRVTPEIAALRCWASRFSYRDKYLPRLYRETLFGAPALAPGERIDDLVDTDELADAFAPQLDAGGAPSGDLAHRLAGAGLRLGSATQIRVEHPGGAWLLEDTATGRAWRLRRDSDAITLYRPAATPADFLDRFLASFEAMLTPLEDRVAAAHLLTDPTSAPQEHLDWLGAWIGLAFDPALPAERRRNWLAAAPALARAHGTRRGLALALDIASGGGVAGGEIVLIENFRLRRLLATLLGVDLADETDPLLPGLTISGNSIVGDTLILAEAETAELLALFREEVATVEENAAVRAFYERLAHRATVLVHHSVSPQDLGLLRRVIELEAPAHVDVRVASATWPLLVGIASLVGVDTYLGPPPRPQPARAEVSSLGMGDYVLGPTSLDPRRSGAAAPAPQPQPPVADAGSDFSVPFGRSFNLNGSGSSAAPGRRIQSYWWTRLPPAP
jgi:phage tail-like protein